MPRCRGTRKTALRARFYQGLLLTSKDAAAGKSLPRRGWNNKRRMRVGERVDAIDPRGCRGKMWRPVVTELRLVPAALIATPGTHHLSNAKCRPTHKPQPAGEQSEYKVKRVVNLRFDENLLVPASWAVRSCSISGHSLGERAARGSPGELTPILYYHPGSHGSQGEN